VSALTDEIKAAVVEALREELPRLLREKQAPAVVRSPEPEACLTVAQAAELSGFGPQSIREKCRSGEIDAVRPGGGRGWRIRKSAFDAWLGKQREPAEGVDIDTEARKIVARMHRQGAA
jgi:excisionase family DNA binding protein